MIKMNSNIFDLIKKANETTLKKHGNEISLERAIFNLDCASRLRGCVVMIWKTSSCSSVIQ